MTLKNIRIGSRLVGQDQPPMIIAEMSGNHNQSLDRALALVEAAAGAGAHALKLQTYTADTMTLDLAGDGFSIKDPDSPWSGVTLYELYKQAHTPWEWHRPIFERCRSLGMLAFSSPFDNSAVDFLETLDVPCYKIASFENTDIPLIRKVASTGRPVIISAGMANTDELDESVRNAREAGCRELILLKCTSTYPALPDETNLRTIPDMRKRFSCEIGLSDHTAGIGAAVASVSLGASVIEKHFTLRRADGGVDSTFSLEPDELQSLVIETERAWRALGAISYGPTKNEQASMQYRRSLYVVIDMKAGDQITPESVRAIRPGHGLPTRYLESVLGKRVTRDVSRGTPLSWEFIG